MLPGLLSRYPQLRIEAGCEQPPVSLVGERIDVAIRITDNPEPGMIARRLGSAVPCCARRRSILQTHGTPEQVEELAHNCLHYSFFRSGVALPDAGRGKRQRRRERQPQRQHLVIVDGGGGEACGIAMLPEQEAHAVIEQGTLVPVLSSLTPKALAIHGIYQSREYQPAALRVFLDEIAHHLSGDAQRE
ncbi:hypothetical protein KIF59_02925 [Enterobacter cloacae subsp. cloacae]|nr:hypothetical protein [Enterobacter cloacae subsp. cloacae]